MLSNPSSPRFDDFLQSPAYSTSPNGVCAGGDVWLVQQKTEVVADGQRDGGAAAVPAVGSTLGVFSSHEKAMAFLDWASVRLQDELQQQRPGGHPQQKDHPARARWEYISPPYKNVMWVERQVVDQPPRPWTPG
eukprot:TRINITY_DN2131_c8_g1_i1.p2 TRINITY_DN2131_c8_g1~~TRINITY_DN2131_c8_g1_i1.p2  ORF type:complete len:134 (+),score=50.63 TRINITY_DN2131_c8_g1_i1:123-524(+)